MQITIDVDEEAAEIEVAAQAVAALIRELLVATSRTSLGGISFRRGAVEIWVAKLWLHQGPPEYCVQQVDQLLNWKSQGFC